MLHANLSRSNSRSRLTRILMVAVTAIVALGLVQPVANAASAATKRSLSITAKPASAPTSSLITISGALTKSPKGSPVTVQRKSGRKWVKIRGAKTGKTGAYATRIVLPSKAGTYTFRATTAAKGKLKAATSRTIKITALTAVRASLTASPTTVAAGASTKLSGKVTPFVRGTTVALQRLDGAVWRTVATTPLTATGTFSKAVAVTTSAGFRVSVPRVGLKASAVSLSAFVRATPVISTSSLPNAEVSTPYSATLTAVGGAAGTWSVTPDLHQMTGLTLDSATGTISGTPTTASTATTYSFTYKQTLTGLSTTKPLPLTVDPAPVPQILTSSLPTGQEGSPYSVTLKTVHDVTGTWTATGLPSGLSLVPSTGVISGLPATHTTATVTIGFSNSGGSDSAILSLVINPPPPPSIRTTSLPNALAGHQYSVKLEASGGATGTWSVSTGVLPFGMQLNASTGVISGSSVVSTTHFSVGFTNGDGTAAPVALVLRVVANAADLNDVVVSAGGSSTCQIRADQSLWCWGYTDSGQTGTGATPGDGPGLLAPKQVTTPAATDWTVVSVSGNALPTEEHACGLDGTTAYCWGSDIDDMLGFSSTTGFQTTPQAVSGGLSWADISAGFTNTCGVTTGGALYCWGDNTFSQLGTGGGDVSVPTQVGTATDWESVSTGYTSSCAVKNNGTLFCWGSNVRGALGTGTRGDQATPTQVGTDTWTSVSVAEGYACGRQTTGGVYCWGPASHGELGNGNAVNDTSTDVLSPRQVGTSSPINTATDWTSVTAGGSHTCAVNVGNELWCWGENGSDQLGDTTNSDRSAPTQIGSTLDWLSVSAGKSHTCGTTTDGSTYCWGSNAKGRLGINSAVIAMQATPAKVN